MIYTNKKDTKKDETKEKGHIEQFVTGALKFGNAGIDDRKKEKGYVAHLCSMDENSRFVDLALKKEHVEQIRDGAIKILEELENNEIKERKDSTNR